MDFSRLSPRKVYFILFFLGFFSYANAIFHPFVHDDVIFIRNNPIVKQISIRDVFSSSVHFDEKGSLINVYYRPVLELFYGFQYQIFGFKPYGYHFFNIFLHIINGCLIYGLLSRMYLLQKAALFSAVLFVIHPVQTEAVACISGISNLVFVLFCLGSFWFYFLKKRFTYMASLMFFLLALFSKEQAVVLPFLIGWYELCLGQKRGKELFKAVIP